MPPEPGSARRWPAYAHGDLALAEAGAAAHVPFLLLCFHAQQAAEKAVKAVLVAHGIEAPRTHNLGILVAAFRSRSRRRKSWNRCLVSVSMPSLVGIPMRSRRPIVRSTLPLSLLLVAWSTGLSSA